MQICQICQFGTLSDRKFTTLTIHWKIQTLYLQNLRLSLLEWPVPDSFQHAPQTFLPVHNKSWGNKQLFWAQINYHKYLPWIIRGLQTRHLKFIDKRFPGDNLSKMTFHWDIFFLIIKALTSTWSICFMFKIETFPCRFHLKLNLKQILVFNFNSSVT